MKKQVMAVALAVVALSGVFANVASAEMTPADNCVANAITATPRTDGKVLLDIKGIKLTCEKQTGTQTSFYAHANSAMKYNK